MKKNIIKSLAIVALVGIASIGLVACNNDKGGGGGGKKGGAPQINPLAVFGGAMSVPASGADRGRLNTFTMPGNAPITHGNIGESDFAVNGIRKTTADFDLLNALAAYEGFTTTVDSVDSSLPGPETDFVPFVYEEGWELDIRIIVEIRRSNGTLVPRNQANPDVRALWEDGAGIFWDVNTLHNRGLGTQSTGGEASFMGMNAAGDTRVYDFAYKLNATTLQDFNEMTFFMVWFVADTYEITFRMGVATFCEDAVTPGHNPHYQTYAFNDLATVKKTFTVQA